MTYIPDQQSSTGQFLPTTTILDVARLQEVEVTSPEFKELLVRLYQSVNNIALSSNTKEFGYYLTEELVNSQLYFNPTSSNQLDLRPCFRKVINLGALGAGISTFAHGITIDSTFSFTRIYGAVSNTTIGNYLPLPYSDVSLGGNIELRLDNTNAIINNASGLTFTVGYIVVEYLKA